MKIKAGLLSHKVGDQYVTVASGEAGDVFCGMLRSNETVMELLRMLEQETTEEQLVDGLFAKYDAPPGHHCGPCAPGPGAALCYRPAG